jgi:hypothetical protein
LSAALPNRVRADSCRTFAGQETALVSGGLILESLETVQYTCRESAQVCACSHGRGLLSSVDCLDLHLSLWRACIWLRPRLSSVLRRLLQAARVDGRQPCSCSIGYFGKAWAPIRWRGRSRMSFA